jgi:type I restriction enzyme S subunit
MSELTDTGISWVGDIPHDWGILPLFSTASENKKKNKENNNNVLSLSYGKIIKRDLSKNFGLLPENFDGYQVVDNGYIIIRSTDLQNDKKSLRVGLVNEYGIITSAYIGLLPSDNMCSDYLFYYLNMCDLKKVFYSLGGGLRQSLRFEEFRRFPIIIPPKEEQKLISCYLAKKTKQIEQLIDKIDKKIELLREQRSLLINQYVTKGLDPNVEMKDSGIEWIGKIPKHWGISKFKYHFDFGMGETILQEQLTDNGYPVLSATEKYKIFGFYKSPSLVLYEGDIVIPARGNSIGFIKVVRENSVSTQTTIYGKKKTKIDSKFFSYFCEGNKPFLFQFERTAIPQITVQQVKNNIILIPPINEQEHIRLEIDKKYSLSETLINKLINKKSLLKEYCQSLIYSMVTGKVRITEDMI